MNPRQAFALAHPLSDPDRALMARLQAVHRHGGTGLLVNSILAVDR